MLRFDQTQEMESDDSQIQLLRGTCYTPTDQMFTITFFTITHFGLLIREKRNAQQEHMKLITNLLIPAAFFFFWVLLTIF